MQLGMAEVNINFCLQRIEDCSQCGFYLHIRVSSTKLRVNIELLICVATVVNVSAVESKCFRYCKYFKCCTISGSFGWAAILENIANFWHKCRRRAILQKAWKTKELLVLWYLVPANFRQSKSAVWLAQSILLLEIEISRYSYVLNKKKGILTSTISLKIWLRRK